MTSTVKRRITYERLIAMIRELREDTLAGKFATDAGVAKDEIKDALHAVFRDSEILDEELACFVVVCVGEWMKRGYGGDPRLETMVVVKP